MKRINSRIKALIVLYDEDLLKNHVDEEGIDKLLKEDDEDFSYDVNYYNLIVNGVRENLYAIDKLISICLSK